ncbi:iron-sulfur cluster repair di-iron protein [Flavihumibacter petaseus]|uniref:Putative iron-sulfur cluster repair protein n=1 Tax=Flavihumibacter petaseus NBRC 106054 TaxID=1220578 RepID=A0A0E9MZY3_9BACT|nr:iron-sulfur cluster repair di-iron protein [Flavihumibacter petaseus]GAO42690.1 putative iron-sulfur cluster repair protein [Flavihumibacter petaseus NBRC 106054]
MPTVSQENFLNVTLLEPREKHPAIFRYFDGLPDGETLTIYNDHDPKPLYYQLLGERGNVFTWEYLEQGPQWWTVNITRRMPAANEETLGQIAARDLRKAEVFRKYGLDFCCGGRKTVKEACAEKGLDVVKIEQELQHTDKYPAGGALAYDEWPLDFLADYIVNTHHKYVRKTLPELTRLAAKVAGVHGNSHPELQGINTLVTEINEELSAHLIKEERVLFPYIKGLVQAEAKGEALLVAPFNSVQQPISLMEMEHELAGKHLETIRTISRNYAVPEDACASYSLLFRLLEEFEADLHIHIHLENNILFPKALQLEKNNSKSATNSCRL